MTKKEETTDFMGKYTGYKLIDGAYYLAPMYTDKFAKLSDRAIAIDWFVKGVTQHVTEINKEIASEQRMLFDKIFDDLGLARDKKYYYHSRDGTIREKEVSSEQGS